MTRLAVTDKEVCLSVLAERVAARPRIGRITLTIAPDDQHLQPARLNLPCHAVRPALEQKGVEVVREGELARKRSKHIAIDHESVGANVNVRKFRKPRIVVAQAFVRPGRANQTNAGLTEVADKLEQP